MGDVAVTELTELDADKVAGVKIPANGTPFLLLKAADDKETCPTCDGSGKIRGGNVTCPDCKGSGEVAAKASDDDDDEEQDGAEQEQGDDDASKSDSDEADEQEKEMTGEDDASKAAESGASQNDLPDSAFAHIEPGGKKDAEGKTTPRSLRHYPVHDKAHADNAASRASAQEKEGDAKAKGIAKAAMPKIKAAQAKFSKGDVQDALKGTATPEVGGHLDSGNSGAAGSVTGDPKNLPPLLAQDGRHATSSTGLTVQADGGESMYDIPIEARVTTASGMRKASVIASFAGILEQIDAAQQQAAKDGSLLTAVGSAAAPGSMPWESYDSATLAQVSECLASCAKAVETIVKRELVEGDMDDAFDLECAASAIQEALGIAALLTFSEKAEGEAATKSAETFAAKVGRVLSGKNLGSLSAARDHLNAVIDGARAASAEDSHDEETDIMSTVTKEELSALFQEEADKALSKAMDEVVKRLEKNANNGGDISEGEIKPTKTADADDVNSVGAGVDSQYVNKEAEGDSDAEAATQEDGDLEKELAEVRAQMESMQKSLDKIAKRPRAGGPLLDGQARGLAAAAEGRMGEATKGEADGGEIEQLQKSLEAATDPVEREQLGLALSKARLTKLYEGRFVSA